MQIALGVVGGALVLATWSSVVRALVVPRRSRDRVPATQAAATTLAQQAVWPVLTPEEHLSGAARIASTSSPLERTPEQAWPDVRGWRVNDDPVAPLRPPNRLPTPSQEA